MPTTTKIASYAILILIAVKTVAKQRVLTLKH